MKTYSGKSIEEILDVVAKEKNVSTDELHYYITEEKKGLLFNLGSQVTAEVYADSDVDRFIEAYLKKFFQSLDLDVDITVTKEEEYYRILLNAENNAILIGKNGQTLEALNTVLKNAVNAEFKKRYHMLVDINNYKTDRYDKIKGMAYRIANSVQRTHINAALDPMPADERRIIHNFLSDMKHIRTESEGEGRDRRIRIIYDADKA